MAHHLAGTSGDPLAAAVATDSSLPLLPCRLTDTTPTTATTWSVRPTTPGCAAPWDVTGWTAPLPLATASLPATGWGQTDSQTPETDFPLPDPSWTTELDRVLTPTSETEIPLVPDLPQSTMSAAR